MPVPQPSVLVHFISELKDHRDYCKALNISVAKAQEDSTSLRSKFVASDPVADGLGVLWNIHPDNVEARMREMLQFGFDSHSSKTIESLKTQMLNENLVPVRHRSLTSTWVSVWTLICNDGTVNAEFKAKCRGGG